MHSRRGRVACYHVEVSSSPAPLPPSPSLAARRIAVTGANRGLGRAIAAAAVAAGAEVIVHARDAANAERTRVELGARAAVAGDLTDPGLGARLADTARALGGLDGIVLSAGVLGPKGRLGELDFDAFREVMAVNVEAQARMFAACVPLLVAARGRVIWVSSGLGRFALPRYGAYCASKHALEGLAGLAHAEYIDQGVLSFSVAPGMVQTKMLAAALEEDDVSEYTLPEVAARGFVSLLGLDHEAARELAGLPLDIASAGEVVAVGGR